MKVGTRGPVRVHDEIHIRAQALVALLSTRISGRHPLHSHRCKLLPRPIAATSRPEPPPVTTTVVVHGEVKDDYLSRSHRRQPGRNATQGDAPLRRPRSPATDQRSVSRALSDVVKNDASVGEDYAPVGYYGDFQIRGFPIDLATGLRSTA